MRHHVDQVTVPTGCRAALRGAADMGERIPSAAIAELDLALPSMLIGRDAELHEIEARTRVNRLVTVVGPGGVGKTALARAVAASIAASGEMEFLDVDLTRVEDGRSLPGVVAAQLGFDSFEAVLSTPADRPSVMVLDNCEHLLDAAAAVTLRLLGAREQMVVIATGRSPLDVPGESVVALAPLLPPRAGDDLTASPAVQLFLQRARDAGTSADLDLELAGLLCRRLDGLPLAIEIAAARLRTMSLVEIVDRLDDTIDVLHRPRFRGDPRHRSIAEAIRWSVDLLPDHQVELLERLSVFRGAFTAASARTIAGGAETFDDDLDDLVHASLIALDGRTGSTRYRMLDTVRRFALHRLERAGGLADVYDRFVDDVIERINVILRGADAVWRPALVRELVGAYDDMAEALDYTVVHDASPDRSRRLSGMMWPIVHQGHAEEIAELCRRTAERWPPDGSGSGALSVAAHATAEYVTGKPERAVTIARQAMAALSRPSVGMITLYRVLGQANRALDDLPSARRSFRDGADVAHRLAWTAMGLELDVAAAQVLADMGDVDDALNELDLVLANARELDSVITTCWARTTSGWIMLRRDPSAAQPLIDAALDQARQIDYPIAIAVGLRSQAYAHLLAGRSHEAVVAAQQLFDELVTRGALSNSRILVDVVAAIAHRLGHSAWDRLAASARALPVTTLTILGGDLVHVPEVTVSSWSRRDALAVVGDVLAELAATTAMDSSTSSAVDSLEHTARQFLRVGSDVVEFAFDGRTVAVRATKGINDIVRLIEAAGTEVHASDLAGASVDQSSTGDVIDAVARRQYEDRIRELQSEIDEAESNSDFERAYRHQVEFDSLIEHLTAALGHANRTRRGADTAERARSAVTHRVRHGIRQLERAHPRLGRHLTHAVRTGTWFAYEPEQNLIWDVERRPAR
jgi:predicted ATPase